MSEEKQTPQTRRILLSVPNELDDVLERIAVAYGKPKATVITDILKDSLPSLKKIATVSEKLKVVQEGVANLWKRKPDATD